MRIRIAAVIAAVLGMLILPVNAAAEDVSAKVSAADSKIETQGGTLKAYPDDKIDPDSPMYNLNRVTVLLRNDENRSLYERAGDRVNLFIKSNNTNEIGWFDKNDNNDCETGEEMKSADLASVRGVHITGARLNRGGSVTFYISSRKPGTPEIRVYTDENGNPGDLIGIVYLNVGAGEGSVNLILYDEETDQPLKGHAGSVRDPYSVAAGERFLLEASVKLGGISGKDKMVSFQAAQGTGRYETIGTVKTDEDGLASLRYEVEDAGLYSFQAVVEDWRSAERYLQFTAGRAGNIESEASDYKYVTQGEEYVFDFIITDDYGNPVDSKGETVAEFSISNPPSNSKYLGFYGEPAKTDYTGKTTFQFIPDRVGSYTIRCQLVNKRDSYTFHVEAKQFNKATSIQAVLKKGEITIPGVQYTDTNSDGKPEIAGRLEITRMNSDGHGKKLVGGDTYDLVFTPSDPKAVTIEPDGDIIVNDPDFTGGITVQIEDTEYNVSTSYELMVAGQPVAIKPEAVVDGRKAEISLQYIDNKGNNTYYAAKENYQLELPVSGIASADIVPFDVSGKATFTLYSEELKEHNILVTASRTQLRKSFPVIFKAPPAPKQIIGARNLLMFIGVRNYSQDGAPKSSDVAPFIKEGRTFVPVRPVADALGAEIAWNEATRTVTLTRSDRTVTIVVGSGAVNVLKEGITTIVTADVPAFIQDGRTVLPFRAVGEAFEAGVSYDASTSSVSYIR